MTMKKLLMAMLALTLALTLTACSGGGTVTYKDGTYEGQSEVYEGDEEGNGDGYGVATITLKDNVIVDAEFHTYQTDGTLKDTEYGKKDGEIANRDFYNKAQKAVMACAEYAKQLAETGSLDKVDAISGASISYSEFKEAVTRALDKAKQ